MAKELRVALITSKEVRAKYPKPTKHEKEVLIRVKHATTGLASRVILLREKKKWSQSQLADYTEMQRSVIWRIENKKYFPGLVIRQKLAECFGIEEKELMNK